MMFRLSSCCVALLLLIPGASAQQVIGEVYATDATVKGSVVLSSGGTRLMSGSSVSAGDATAVLKLTRGGEVRVCANTSLSVSASPNGRELLLAMGSGALETHYQLGANADSLLTPDFRIQMPGPGQFHVALGADARGNTCVHSSSDSAAVMVTELMGDGSYQVKPGEHVRFAKGSIAGAATDTGDCGCPAPPPPVIKTEAPAPRETQTVEKASVTQATTEAALTAPPPPDPSSVHVTMDAPFVFNASGPPPPKIPDAPPMQRRDLSRLQAIPQPGALPPATAAEPAAAKKKSEKRGFFSRLRGFFASVFRG